MSDKFWFSQVDVLLNRRNLSTFWPTKYMTFEEKMNALSRFVIYGSTGLTIMNEEISYLIMGMVIIMFVGIVSSRKTTAAKRRHNVARHVNPEKMSRVEETCKKPTKDNPMMNQLTTDYGTNKRDFAVACPVGEVAQDIKNKFFTGFEQDPFDLYDKKHSQRQFTTMPNTDIPSDQKNFALWLYGRPEKMCKSDPSSCSGMFKTI
jgi:hypothetical protein